jgi:hypothetical protein
MFVQASRRMRMGGAMSAAPIWIGPPNRRNFPRDRQKIEAALYQPTETG